MTYALKKADRNVLIAMLVFSSPRLGSFSNLAKMGMGAVNMPLSTTTATMDMPLSAQLPM